METGSLLPLNKVIPNFSIQYNTIQYNTIQYNTIQYNTIQYNQYNTIQYNTIQYNTIQYNTIQYNTIQYNTIQYNTIQYNTIQYNTIQYNTIQYNTIQYNTIQYNTINTRGSWLEFLSEAYTHLCQLTISRRDSFLILKLKTNVRWKIIYFSLINFFIEKKLIRKLTFFCHFSVKTKNGKHAK